MNNPTETIGTTLLRIQARSTLNPAVKFKKNGQWKSLTWLEYYHDIEKVAYALLSLGVSPGQKIAIMSNTRYEWSLVDWASLGIQAVVVPIYPNSTPDEIEFILNHSESQIFFCENKASIELWRKIKTRCPAVQKVICFEIDRPEDKSLLMWQKFLTLGSSLMTSSAGQFRRLCDTLKPSQLATIVYTSGTTGQPKGALLTHEQIFSEISEALTFCGVNSSDTTLAFLPFAHVLGRIEHWGHMYIGFTMAYAESLEKMRMNLLDIKPTVLVAVPRIFEKVYSAIYNQIEAQKIKKSVFEWALKVGQKVGDLRLKGQVVPLPLILEYELAKKLMINHISQLFGGRLRFAISGGAPLSTEISNFFHAARIVILEGYGLTETTAAICVNTPYNYKFGSVGRPIGDVQLKIDTDGEILVKSKKVMKGYYKDPESTKKVFEGDWLRTGDIGIILPSGDLKITDRKKDLIKTAGGKYVAPQKLEGLLKSNPLIAHSLIHGDQKKYIVALITLDKSYLEKMAKEKNWDYHKWTDLIKHPEIQNSIKNTIVDVNAQLSSYETIKQFKILPREFSVEGGELTPSLKVKRKILDQKFKDIIDSLYT